MSQTSGIFTQDLTFAHIPGQRNTLDGVDLDLEPGQIIGLIGPNGSGKTTLLKILAGMLNEYEGTALIDGEPIGVETKKRMAYLPDRSYFSNWMHLKDLLAFHREFFSDFDQAKAEYRLQQMGLDLNKPVLQLSKGEQERIALILTMSRRAKVYLLDEPLGAVDPAMRELVFRTILTDFPEDSLVLLTTHLIQEAEPYLDRVIFLRQGRLEREVESEELRESTGKSIDQVFREVFRVR